MKDYVDRRGEGYYVTGSRVSLDSIVIAYWRGQAPESIHHSYPSLGLDQIYGAIAFYLSNRDEIDNYLKEWEVRTEERRLAAHQAHPTLHAQLSAARQEMLSPRK